MHTKYTSTSLEIRSTSPYHRSPGNIRMFSVKVFLKLGEFGEIPLLFSRPVVIEATGGRKAAP